MLAHNSSTFVWVRSIIALNYEQIENLMTKVISRSQISLAGEFAVLSQLSLRGFDANLTLGNTKNVDILISDPKENKLYKCEAKTSYASKPSRSKLFGYTLSWFMSEKHETINDPNLFYCFVSISEDFEKYRYFMVPSKVVAKYVKKQHEVWVKENPSVADDISIRQFRIGLEKRSRYSFNTPLAQDYENNWSLK